MIRARRRSGETPGQEPGTANQYEINSTSATRRYTYGVEFLKEVMPILKLSYAQAAQLRILAMKDCGFIDSDGRCRKDDTNTQCKQLASVHRINCDHLLYSLLPNYPSLCGTIAKFNLSE